jgi:hypothetical protein
MLALWTQLQATDQDQFAGLDGVAAVRASDVEVNDEDPRLHANSDAQ